MLRSRFSVLAAAAVALAPVSALSASITFTDSTFNSANYTESPAYTSNATLAYDFCANCGQSGVPGLQVTIVSTGSGTNPGLGVIAFINTGFSYNPASGEVLSISASVDKILTDSIINPGAVSSFHPTIEQGGNYYVATITGPTIPPGSDTTGWSTIAASGLQWYNFEEYDFTIGSYVAAFPNFSGGPMLFGLTQNFDNPGTFNATAIYDPLQISLTTVPEPSTWTLLALGFAGLGFAARRERRKTAVATT